jgi:hypothetical protein
VIQSAALYLLQASVFETHVMQAKNYPATIFIFTSVL